MLQPIQSSREIDLSRDRHATENTNEELASRVPARKIDLSRDRQEAESRDEGAVQAEGAVHDEGAVRGEVAVRAEGAEHDREEINMDVEVDNGRVHPTHRLMKTSKHYF